MNIACTKCRNRFEVKPELLFKQGPLFDYLKCPACGKITAVKKEGLPEDENTINTEAANEKSKNQDPQKPFTVSDSKNSSVGSIPFMITAAVRQQLYQFGYSSQDVDGMKPEEGQALIKSLKAKPNNMQQQGQQKLEVPGWLIVHDEAVRTQTFDLKLGKNIIGRKSSMSVDIAVETDDLTMGRRHCFIEVVLNETRGEFNFLISDLKAVNGTIINGRIQRKLSEEDVIYLNDGDTFQLGLTKIVFKKNTELKRKETVVKEVLNQLYQPTVVISKDKVEHIFKTAYINTPLDNSSDASKQESVFNDIDTARFQKRMKIARIWLYLLSAFNFVVGIGAFFLYSIRNGEQFALKIFGTSTAVALTYFILALWSRKNPAIAFSCALILFLVLNAAALVLYPQPFSGNIYINLWMLIVYAFKVMVLIALVKGYKSTIVEGKLEPAVR